MSLVATLQTANEAAVKQFLKEVNDFAFVHTSIFVVDHLINN